MSFLSSLAGGGVLGGLLSKKKPKDGGKFMQKFAGSQRPLQNQAPPLQGNIGPSMGGGGDNLRNLFTMNKPPPMMNGLMSRLQQLQRQPMMNNAAPMMGGMAGRLQQLQQQQPMQPQLPPMSPPVPQMPQGDATTGQGMNESPLRGMPQQLIEPQQPIGPRPGGGFWGRFLGGANKGMPQ